MGQSFYILVWEGWGCGLEMVNPRIHHECSRDNDNGIPSIRNSFSYQTEEDISAHLKRMKICERFGNLFKVIR